MKKTALLVLLGIAVISRVNAQQLPKSADSTLTRLGIKPLLTDSIAQWPRFTTPPAGKLQLKTDGLIYSRMPAVKPQGNYKMPVVNPATPGVNYTMMVKRMDIEKPVEPVQP